MQQQLSPKRYIQTRARTLPIYRCLVNKDWEEDGLVQVFILRQHVTGNITAGFYLVDLLCLGVKETFFYFNEPERDIMDLIPKDNFVEVDYALAHNIVYAGYEFAMKYGIPQAKDFEVTRFILQSDTDAVPLIDIHTGDEDGKPHLIVESPGQYGDALAKLKASAGEGGYRYTVALGLKPDDFGRNDDEEDEADDEEDEEADSDYDLLTIDDFPDEDILPLDAQFISDDDLFDEQKINSREQGEQFTLKLELLLRVLHRLRPELFFFGSIENLPEYRHHLTRERVPILNGSGVRSLGDEEEAEMGTHARLERDLVSLMGDKEAFHKKVGELTTEYRDDPRAALRVFEILMYTNTVAEHPDLVRQLQGQSGHFPLVHLMLALAALDGPDVVPGNYSDVYDSSDISDVFPEYEVFHDEELCLYWMIQLLLAADAADLPAAIKFYFLIAETEVFSAHLTQVQIALLHLLEPVIRAIKAEQDAKK